MELKYTIIFFEIEFVEHNLMELNILVLKYSEIQLIMEL